MSTHTITIGSLPNKLSQSIDVMVLARHIDTNLVHPHLVTVEPLYPKYAILEALEKFTGRDKLQIRPNKELTEQIWIVVGAYIV
jgi:hypothetical protein